MKILFYSTNSNFYSHGKITLKMIPSCFEQWNNLKQKFPEHDFTVVMQMPGMFLFDESCKENPFVNFIFVEQENSGCNKIAQMIIEQKPDIAIAVTYWTQPFDWLGIKDSMIAELLCDAGIKTVCHSAKTSAICFDKFKTHLFLRQNNFNFAPAVYVHHEMFYAERSKNTVAENVYKEYVFSEIKKLKFPVVIKDTAGLSSFGMDVASTFAEARHILLSKKNNGDRLVEEFLDGQSFGIEVYGTDGNYTVSAPLINSVNQFGLTSPKQNVKLGPVENALFKTDELKNEILRLANLLEFSGIAQIDLIFSCGKWYIVEINSRISGMTQTMAASMNMSLYELILFSAGIAKWDDKKFLSVMNLKFPLLDEGLLKKLSSVDFVYAVNQIENNEAKQLREVGYAEVIFGQTLSLDETMSDLETLNKLFSDKMEKKFYDNAKALALITGKK